MSVWVSWLLDHLLEVSYSHSSDWTYWVAMDDAHNGIHPSLQLGASQSETSKRRLPPINVAGGLFNLCALKSPAYTIYFIFPGLKTVSTYIDNDELWESRLDFFYLIFIADGSSRIDWNSGLHAAIRSQSTFHGHFWYVLWADIYHTLIRHIVRPL